MRAALLLAALAGAAGAAQAYGPATNYAIHCQGCHLADGSETPGKVPALAGSLARFLRHPRGRAYLVRVPGVANAPLSDAELAALLDWTLRRFDGASLPPDFAPYTAEEVGRLRRDPLLDVNAERAEILRR
jgi:mono/diheme cytochrome c family protein